MQWVGGGAWKCLPEVRALPRYYPLPHRAWDGYEEGEQSLVRAAVPRRWALSRCTSGQRGRVMISAKAEMSFQLQFLKTASIFLVGFFCNSFLLSSSTLFIYLSLCSLWNCFSHMSFIVLKPWALILLKFGFVLFSLSLQLFCISLNSLTLWPDSYPVVGIALHYHPPLSQECRGGDWRGA